MPSFGPDKVVLPVGTTSDRPSSPAIGFMRYNTDKLGVEMYTNNGWIIGGGVLGSASNPATSGISLYNAGYTTTGIYWLKGSLGYFQAYIKHDYGGGWINMNTNMGPYLNTLTCTYGTGGSNMLSGASGISTDLLNCSGSTQSQANTYGCTGDVGKTTLFLNSTFSSDFSITQVRLKIYISASSSVTCGPYWTNSINGLTIISGSSIQVQGTCNNPPNDWTSLTGSGFTVEFYGTLNDVTKLLYAWTACGGSFTMQLKELYVR